MAPEPYSTTLDHWRPYSTNLLEFYRFSDGKFDPKTQAFFAVPVGKIVIPVGEGVTEAQTNSALYNVADALLDVTSPVLTSGVGSHFDRQSRHLQAVQLPQNGNAGAKMRLQTAQRRRDDLRNAFMATKSKANEAYEMSKEMPGNNLNFRDWASRNYPLHTSMERELQQAEAAFSAASREVHGDGAEDLHRRVGLLKQAQDKDDEYPDLNMEAVPDSGAGKRSVFLPLYSMVGDYPGIAAQWRSQYLSPLNSLQINMDFTPPPDEAWWKDSGFPGSVEVPDIYSLFWSKPDQSAQATNESHWTARKLDYRVSVKLRIRGIKAFDIKAGSWDGDLAKLYNGKKVSLKDNLKLQAACAVSTIIMAYNATYEVTLGPVAAKQVQDDFSKATQAGGAFSLLGTPIAVPGSKQEPPPVYKLSQEDGDDFTRFTVSQDKIGHPMVLGIIGRRLPQIGH